MPDLKYATWRRTCPPVSVVKDLAEITGIKTPTINKLRVVRVLRLFSELRVMLNSVLGSIMNLFWSIVMLEDRSWCSSSPTSSFSSSCRALATICDHW